MFSRRLEVDLGELKNERESLSSFLRLKLKVNVSSKPGKILIKSETLSPQTLKRTVNKFIYRRNLMNRYWVALEKGVVRINKLKRPEKQKTPRKKGTPPSIIKHGF